ncbi:MAG: hypothetical protein HRT35_27635 [Algicola sp.]|nr:hypothetical protein [Algicola sp.]
MASLIGDQNFRKWVDEKRLTQLAAVQQGSAIQSGLTMAQVICGIANDYGVTVDDITKIVRGPQKRTKQESWRCIFVRS